MSTATASPSKLQRHRDRLERPLKLSDLTNRQKEILRYILQCWMSGFIPSIREIGYTFGITSPNGVVCHLQSLKNKGYLEEVEEKASLMLADKALELVI